MSATSSRRQTRAGAATEISRDDGAEPATTDDDRSLVRPRTPRLTTVQVEAMPVVTAVVVARAAVTVPVVAVTRPPPVALAGAAPDRGRHVAAVNGYSGGVADGGAAAAADCSRH